MNCIKYNTKYIHLFITKTFLTITNSLKYKNIRIIKSKFIKNSFKMRKIDKPYNLFRKNNWPKKTSKTSLKKKIIKNLFLHQLKLQIFNKYLFLILKQEQKNSYVNVMSMSGQVIYEKHTGCLYKTSLRKSSYALEHLLKIVTNYLLELGVTKKKRLFIIIKGNYTKRGLRKKLFNCLKMGLTFKKIIIKPLVAHNGVRLRRQRRK